MPPLKGKSNWDYLGIDPGQSGGMALVCTDDYVSITPMPPTERDVIDWIRGHDTNRIVAVIEKVHSMPKQGVASSFKFGMGYGGLRMALIAAGIPFEEVDPRTWMKALGIPPRKKILTATQWKHSLRAKAQQLFPQVDVTLKTADALLIALYCQRKHNGISD